MSHIGHRTKKPKRCQHKLSITIEKGDWGRKQESLQLFCPRLSEVSLDLPL